MGDAFDHICYILGDSQPQGAILAWDDRYGGIQVFYARRDCNQTLKRRPTVFAGRLPDGQILGLSSEHVEMVQFGLDNSPSPEDFIGEEFLLLSRWALGS